MKKNILIAFILNLCFSVFEVIGGLVTGSVAILSDSLHDFGDALSIGVAVILEKKSIKKPDNCYTYGYGAYSVLGGFITTAILFLGSAVVIIGSVKRILNPVEINYEGMIIFAIIGVAVNFAAAFITHSKESINEKAVNLHMLEDVLGWVTVLVGAIVMKFTDISVLDPILSMGVALFILVNAIKNLKEILNVFLNKTPENISVDRIKDEVLEIEGVCDAHHIHVISLDGAHNVATLHIVAEGDFSEIKHKVKHTLEHLGISHTTVELESRDENCEETDCNISDLQNHSHGHSHHHHHH